LGEQVNLVDLTDGPHGERGAELQDLDAAGLETVESADGVWARCDDNAEVGADGAGRLVAVGTRRVVYAGPGCPRTRFPRWPRPAVVRPRPGHAPNAPGPRPPVRRLPLRVRRGSDPCVRPAQRPS